MKASPGEINTSPVNNVAIASNQFQKFAVPIAAFASIMLPLLTSSQQANAAETAAPEEVKVVLGPVPTDFGLTLKDFYADAQKVLTCSPIIIYYCQI